MIHNLNQSPISTIEIGKAKLIEGSTKIIHNINVSVIESMILSIDESIHSNTNSVSNKLIEHKLTKIKTNLEHIKPKHKRRFRRWDALGKAWKWLAGSPDADDLKLIDTSVNQLVSNNNEQITINNQLLEKLNNMTHSLNDVISVDSSNYHVLTTEIDQIKAIIKLDMIEDEIEAIQNAILFSKLDLINNRILTAEEVKLISSSIESQGIPTHLIEEALAFVSTAVITNGEIIKYIISIPSFSKTSFQHLHIEAIVHNSEKIVIPGKLYLMQNDSIYLQTGPCKKLNNWSVCKTTDIKDVSTDPCLSKIITGQSGKCSYEIVSTQLPIMEVTPTILLINNANGTLHNTCGITDRPLIGSYLITYTNCSVSFQNFSFTNSILQIVENPIFTPSINVNITKVHSYKSYGIQEVHELHLKNTKRLEHLWLATSHASLSIWGGLSITSLAIIILAIYVFAKSRHQETSIQISTENYPKAQPEPPAVHYYQPRRHT